MKALKYFLAAVLLTLAAVNTALPQYSQQWTAAYNNGAGDFTNDMIRDAAGNIYVTGGSASNIITIKYNPSGVQQWIATYTGAGLSEGKAITVDAAGNVYVAGPTNSLLELVAIKYNSAGVQQWACIYTGTASGSENVAGIKVDNSGNVYVGADTYSGEVTFRDLVAIKISPSGTIDWASKYDAGFGNGEESFDMELDAAGNVYISGSAYTNTRNMLVAKWNSSGMVQWAKITDGTAATTDVGRSLAVDGGGNVFISGACNNTGTAMDITIIKYNSAGVQQWLSSYNYAAGSLDHAFDIALDGTGNFYIAGVVFRSGMADSADIAVVKYNSAGARQWTSVYDGPAGKEDLATSITVDISGNVYASGYSTGIGTKKDFTLLKFSASGVQQWVQRTNGAGNDDDVTNKILVDAQYGIYAAGYISTAQNAFDTYLVKYSPLSGIQLTSGELPSSFILSQNYPNPFNPVTNFEFVIPVGAIHESPVKLAVYNSLGKEVAVLVNEPLNAGTYKYSFDGTGLNSGVYFYRLKAGEFSETRKMILIK